MAAAFGERERDRGVFPSRGSDPDTARVTDRSGLDDSGELLPPLRARGAHPGKTSEEAQSDLRILQPADAFAEARDVFESLGFADRVAMGGAGAAVMSCFLPWKETALAGEILGLVSLGFALFLGALLAIGAILVRARRLLPRLHPIAPWLVQLGATCFCVLWCLVFMKLSANATRVPAFGESLELPLSRPVFGVYVALVASLVSLTGTLLGLREKAL